MERASAAVAPPGARRSARLLRLASEERLVALVRAGEERAFEAIYDRHHGPILGFCRHMLGSREEAEDALQHTFLAAYGDLVASTKPIDLRPWLFAIARNRCLSLLRARREHVALDVAEPATDGLTAIVERREDLRELLADLARLPEDQRAALLLAKLGALDHAGIATVLGCPREKVKALVFQARSSLAASREARATPCEQIRLRLATASGGELRRGELRRHLRACEGCQAFRAEIAAQRSMLALALPVVPSAALKAGVLASAGLGGHGGAGATAAAGGATVTSGASTGAIGGVLGAVASTGAAKVAVSAALAGALAGGGVLAVRAEHRHAAHAVAARHASGGARNTAAVAAGGAAPAVAGAGPSVAPAASGGPGAVAPARAVAPAIPSSAAAPSAGTPAAAHGNGSGPRGAHPAAPRVGRAPAVHRSHGSGSTGSGAPSPTGGSQPVHGGRAGATPQPSGGTPAPVRAHGSPSPPSHDGRSGGGHGSAGAAPSARGDGHGAAQAPGTTQGSGTTP